MSDFSLVIITGVDIFAEFPAFGLSYIMSLRLKYCLIVPMAISSFDCVLLCL